MSYEEMILARQEDDTSDDCRECEYKTYCRRQCERVQNGRTLQEIYPQLFIKIRR